MPLTTFDFTVSAGKSGQLCIDEGTGTYTVRKKTAAGSVPYQNKNRFVTVGTNNLCVLIPEAGDYLIQFADKPCCGGEIPSFTFKELAAGNDNGGAGGTDEAKVKELIKEALDASPHTKDTDTHLDAAALATLMADPAVVAAIEAASPHTKDTDTHIDAAELATLIADPAVIAAIEAVIKHTVDTTRSDDEIKALIKAAMDADPHTKDTKRTDAEIQALIDVATKELQDGNQVKDAIIAAMAADPHTKDTTRTDDEIKALAQAIHDADPHNDADKIVKLLTEGLKLISVGDLNGVEQYKAFKPSVFPEVNKPVVDETITIAGMLPLASGQKATVATADNTDTSGAASLHIVGTIQTAPKPNAAGVITPVSLEVYLNGNLVGARLIKAFGLAGKTLPVNFDMIKGAKIEIRVEGGDMIVFPGGKFVITAK